MILHSNIFGEGKPFLILHGFLGMGDNWKTLGKLFAENNFEVHLIDQRNHGRSFHNDEFSYEVLVDDLKTYCEEKKLDDIILLGHSMGGKTAMLFATSYPSIVSKLIIADISPRFYPIHHDAILEGLSALDFTAITSRSQADLYLSNYILEPSTRQFLLKNLYWIEKGRLDLRVNLKVLKENVSEVGEALPIHAEYKGEVLFLKGSRSEYIAMEDEVLIKKHFFKAKIETIENSGHWLHAENPKAFYKAVINFVNSST